ncbi:hypothetical protein JCM3765_004799 [Sporobolomyces pararoseus]
MLSHIPVYTEEQSEYLKWYNQNLPYFYYCAILGFVLLLASLNTTYRLLYSRINKRSNYNKGEEETAGSNTRFWLASLSVYRKWTYRRSILLQIVGIDSAAQGTVILGYFIVTFSMAISGAYGQFDYIAHHCARLCFATIPLLVGLASRELGVIAWITGLHSTTLISLHRWIGRSVIILAGVHVAGRLYTNSPKINLKLAYQAWGLVGLLLWISMSILSIRKIRNRFYKFFIFAHLAAFSFSLIALSLHRPQVAPYIIAGAVLYASDRIVRLGSVAYYSMGRKSRAGPRTTIQLLSKDVMKVEIETKRKWKPGSHAYLHAPLIDAGGHPFSVASSFLPISHLESEPAPTEATQTFIIRVHKGFTLKLKERAEQEQEKMMNDPTKSEESSIQLSNMFTEGPYGHNLRLHRFESVLLVVGGTGVTFAVGFLLDLVRRARAEYLGGARRMSTKRLTFVWTVREAAEIEWIGKELREAIDHAPPGFLNLQIYVTQQKITSDAEPIKGDNPIDVTIRPKPSIASSTRRSSETCRSSISSIATKQIPFDYLPTSPTESMLPPLSLPPISHSSSTLVNGTFGSAPSSVEIPFVQGRCRPREIVEQVVRDTSYSGSVAVATCGPSRLTEEVGRASSEMIDPSKVFRGETRLNIMLHVESYGW